ncbi:hypothetical protein DDD_2091 [Nonlabens dokdonensis DSW-6]|uniref:Uncharacterized protein n=1 Tax=Nonlabens dokdonensis (strain DSM 17205 / KCTC 12402 / DSW-6) TaxID=592029 RepID=L7WEA7_NONDD|nr:hypothetical protein DDD_2091 [Nonlabens dokdonensis DSW-6]
MCCKIQFYMKLFVKVSLSRKRIYYSLFYEAHYKLNKSGA